MEYRVIETVQELDKLPVASVVANVSAPFPLIWMKEWESAHPRKDGTPLSEWDHDGETVQTREINLPVIVLLEAPTERRPAA